jgi:hypothetical protein
MPSQSHEPTLAAKLEDLRQQGVTGRQEQADALDMNLRTLQRHMRREGLTTERGSLKEWIPFTVAEEHRDDPVYRNLRSMAKAAQGRHQNATARRGSAVQWARTLVDAGRDVTYSRTSGFRTPVARVRRDGTWYLKRLLIAAERYITSLPQLDDLGKDSN